MKILIIGNGFDLEHGLPTRYSDFMKFCVSFNQIYCESEKNSADFDVSYVVHNKSFFSENYPFQSMKNFLCDLFLNPDCAALCNQFAQCITYKTYGENCWIQYFGIWGKSVTTGSWVDFEAEMKKVINALCENPYLGCWGGERRAEFTDRGKHFLEMLTPLDRREKMKSVFAREKYLEVASLEKKLSTDLSRLITAFELYLQYYVNPISVTKRNAIISDYHADAILSFNYTDTFERLYDSMKASKYCYVHGKAQIDDLNKMDVTKNSIVIGFENLSLKANAIEDIRFIEFRKYFQRIYKKCDGSYKQWIQQIDTQQEASSLYVFGYTLGVSDAKIFRELLLNKNIHTTVFYYNLSSFKELILNLAQILGSETLFEMTTGSNPAIKFVQQ